MIYITAARVWSGRVSSVREWIEYVGRDHLHHRLEAVLGRPEYAVLFIYAMSCALGVSATVLLRQASLLSAVLLVGQAIVILLMVTILERWGRRAP
jgi:UDP-GlcNAc:undecaprenyl-phosphate GlcNAc-1-phosphate transferase